METRTIAGVKWCRVARDCWEGGVGRVNVAIMARRARYVLDADRAIRIEDLRFTDGQQVKLCHREYFGGDRDSAMTRCVELAEGIGIRMLHRAAARLEAEKKQVMP